MKTFVTLMLGGNIGDTPRIFDTAVELLAGYGFETVARSRNFITSPVDCVPGTPDFFDAALTGYWSGTARELLEKTQQIERACGRPKEHSSAEARTLDIDLITFGMEVICEKDLQIPHPRSQQRLFVLEPLATVAPDLRFPDTGQTLRECLEKCRKS